MEKRSTRTKKKREKERDVPSFPGPREATNTGDGPDSSRYSGWESMGEGRTSDKTEV